MTATTYTVPDLPYAYDALEPYISKEIMTLHHSKHHAAYVNNLNSALATQATALSSADLVLTIRLQNAIRFNAGGHINHTLFWENLTPVTSAATDIATSAPTLHAAILSQWSSYSNFQSAFQSLLLDLKGSGWGWLVADIATGKRLDIVQTKDQDLVPDGWKPLLGVDMWEHAYYLQYFNNKAEYVKGIWQIINWKIVEQRFSGGLDQVYGQLDGLRKNKI